MNKTAILERLGGDEEIFAVMGDMFLSDVDKYCQDLEAARVAGRLDVLRREAHTVKGLLATFADNTGAAMAMAIEEQAKLARTEGLAPAVAELQQRLRLVAEAVRVDLAG